MSGFIASRAALAAIVLAVALSGCSTSGSSSSAGGAQLEDPARKVASVANAPGQVTRTGEVYLMRGLMDLAAAARQVLPDAFQNSGTAARIAELAVPGLAVGALGGLAEGDITGAAKWAAVGLAAPYAGVAALRYPGLASTGAQGAFRNALMSPALRGALTQMPVGYYLSEPAR